MSISFHCTDISARLLGKKKIKHWIESTISSEGALTGNINIIFCTDNYLLEINRKYLSHDYFTDVITFDYSLEKTLSGDIYISIERIRENAKIYAQKFRQELLRVIIHGVLHLCGYNDNSANERIVMKHKEDLYLSIGYL